MNKFKESFLNGNVKGVINSPIDERDYQLSKLIKKSIRLPKEYISPTPLIIENQGNVGCCVNMSIAQCKHIIEYRQNGDTQAFSKSYVYGNRLDTDYHGSGMIPREALRTLKNFGICHDKYMPEIVEYEKAKEIYESNKEFLDEKAKPYRINSYYRLWNKNDVKTSIYTMGHAFISYDVYDSLFNPDKDGIIQYDKDDNELLGGHQMTAVGWNDVGFIIANSWGKDYGIGFKENNTDGGMIVIPYDYKFSECWSMIDNITETDLKNKFG